MCSIVLLSIKWEVKTRVNVWCICKKRKRYWRGYWLFSRDSVQCRKISGRYYPWWNRGKKIIIRAEASHIEWNQLFVGAIADIAVPQAFWQARKAICTYSPIAFPAFTHIWCCHGQKVLKTLSDCKNICEDRTEDGTVRPGLNTIDLTVLRRP